MMDESTQLPLLGELVNDISFHFLIFVIMGILGPWLAIGWMCIYIMFQVNLNYIVLKVLLSWLNLN